MAPKGHGIVQQAEDHHSLFCHTEDEDVPWRLHNTVFCACTVPAVADVIKSRRAAK